MNTLTIVLLVILAVLIVAVVVLYFLGKRAQKKQSEQQAQIDAMKQTVSMLVIDKKRMKIKRCRSPGNRLRADTQVAARFQTPGRQSQSRSPDHVLDL